jgi:mannose-6-phosphate isomerase class I
MPIGYKKEMEQELEESKKLEAQVLLGTEGSGLEVEAAESQLEVVSGESVVVDEPMD